MSRVLMVDDAGLFQVLEASFLRRIGCEILRVEDHAALLARAGTADPDLILLDADHPTGDAPACLEALKHDPALRAIPVLVITPGARLADCAAAGADATLVRPIQKGALELSLASIGRITQRGGGRRAVRLPARLQAPAGAWRGRVKDISRSGVFVALPQPPPLHAAVEVSLRLPGGTGPQALSARGVVVRQVASDPESHLIPGVGVRFVDLDVATESILDSFVRAGEIVLPDPGADDD